MKGAVESQHPFPITRDRSPGRVARTRATTSAAASVKTTLTSLSPFISTQVYSRL